MTVKECYDIFGGGYEEVIARFSSEERIKKYLVKFLDDPSFGILCTSLKEKDREEAFRAVHTLKGLCMNLGLQRLYESSRTLTEILRTGEQRDVKQELQQIEEDYMMTISAIQMLLAEGR